MIAGRYTYRLAGSAVALDDFTNSPSSTIAYEPSKPAGDRWNTSDGSVHYYSKILETAGNHGLPVPDVFRFPLATDEQLPFWLSTWDRVSCFQHSQFREQQTYKVMMPEPFLDINPDAAIPLGIGDGDYVALSTRNGKT
jgi:anaerobic selenocysteine-containing dehydrogenase